eukprot:SAG11_NODE_858_length_6850_cov_11.886535_5_plen_86_part_00
MLSSPGSAATARALPPDVPEELIRLIFLHVGARWAARACAVCRSWRSVGSEPVLWRHRALVEQGAHEMPPWCSSWREVRGYTGQR